MSTNNKYKPLSKDFDNHSAHVAAHRQRNRRMVTYGELMRIYDGGSVEDWLGVGEITNKEISSYPNAKLAAEIKNSPLWQALS